MIDVTFSNNTCGDQCFARLALENDLRGLRLRRNTRLSEENSSFSLMSSPPGSSSSVEDLIAKSNELSVLRVVEGSLEMRGAEIRTSTESSLVLDRVQSATVVDSSFHENSAVFSAAAILSNFTKSLSVSNCSFTSNTAENGAAVAFFDGNLSIDNCSFEDNVATTDAGSLLVSHGTLELGSSIFRNNIASGRGGSILLTKSSSSRLSAVECRNNTARDGGCLQTSASRDLVVRESVMSNNTADNGGAIHCDDVSENKIVDATFAENIAHDRGGGVFLAASVQMELRRVTVNNNSAKMGGGLECSSSEDLLVRRCVFSGNNATLDGGGAGIRGESNARLEEVTWTSNAAQTKGGGLSVKNSSIESHRCNYTGNKASEGAGLMVEDAEAELDNDSFVGNTAELSGGGVDALDANISLKDCFISQNTAGLGGGVHVLRVSTAFHNVNFTENRAEAEGGGGFACEQSKITILYSLFLSNRATSDGGAFDVVNCNVTANNLTIRSNTADEEGGGISCASRTLLNLNNSILQFNSAPESGGLEVKSRTVVHLLDCIIDSNNVSSNAGGIGVASNSTLVLENSRLSSNRAQRSAGAVLLHEGELNVIGGSIVDNEAALDGGFLNAAKSSILNVTNCSLRNNRAANGGCLYVDEQTRVFFRNSTVKNNTATLAGGVAFLANSEMEANMTRFQRNEGIVAGSIAAQISKLQLTECDFTDDKATVRPGGSIVVGPGSSATILNTSLSKSKATSGGGIWLTGSSLAADGLKISECEATENGGAILADASSIFLCSRCTFSDNSVEGHGGAVAFYSPEPQSLALQLNNCTFNNNSADIGGAMLVRMENILEDVFVIGAVYVSTRLHLQDCTKPNASCTSVAVTGSRFSNNRAETSGGAIFTKDPSVIRYSCSPKGTETPPKVYQADTLEELELLKSTRDVCPEWAGNQANLYGPVIASYATSIRGYAVGNGQVTNERPIKNNELVSENHRSGDSLPVLLVEVLDGYGQSPAFGEGDAFVQATMYSPNDLFSGEFNTLVNEKRKSFPPISGFQRPGRYEIQMNFSEPGLEPLSVEVEVRDCRLGEFVQENGALCVLCSGSQYNFDPDASTCQPCPENGNCTTDVIHPNKGYWHRTPCSHHVQQCVSRKACDFSGRENALNELTNDMDTCKIEGTLDRDYSEAQCKKVSLLSAMPVSSILPY